MILARQPQSGFYRIRASRGEKCPCHAIGFEEIHHRFRRFNRRRIAGAGEGGIIGELGQLI